MEIYELRKKEGLESSVYAIAFVENPAIEVGFVALSADTKPKFISHVKLNVEKRMIYTPVLIPNQKIYRKDDEGNEYQIFFKEDTIEQAAHDYVQYKLTDEFNNEHQEKEKLQGVSLVENWIIEDSASDKATKLGFDLPKGTWMAGIKVHNEDIWAKCKDGTYKGISIEGLFDNFTTNFNNNNNLIKMNKSENLVSSILAKLAELTSTNEESKETPKEEVKFASAELQDGGMLYTEGEWEDGVNVYTDEALEVPAPDGEYVLADGRVMAVAGGSVAGLREAVEEDMMKKKEYMERQEQLAEALSKAVDAITELNSKVSGIEEKFAKFQEAKTNELNEVKAELSQVKETPAAKSALKLSEMAERTEGRFNSALRGERFNLKSK